MFTVRWDTLKFYIAYTNMNGLRMLTWDMNDNIIPKNIMSTQWLTFRSWYKLIIFHRHNNETRNTLTHASQNGRKPYIFPQNKLVSILCNKHIQHHLLFQTDKLKLCVEKIPHFFSVLFTMFLVYHDLKQKNKIRSIAAPKYAFTHRNYPNLKCISELFKMYI